MTYMDVGYTDISTRFHGNFRVADNAVDEVAVGTIIADRPRTDPYERSLAHTALISDDWRQAIKNSLSAHPPTAGESRP